MATAGEDTTANAPSAAYEGGGAGGKFRKRPFRRAQATPYDRPPTALRNPSWLSKLVVDPASKLINAGARRLFASFFTKTLPPPPSHPPLPAIPAPPPSETTQDPKDVHKASGPNNRDGDFEPDVHKHGDTAYDPEGSAFSELEQLLKQKTFTRFEIDQLTELLHSKAVDSPLEDAGKRIEVSRLASADISRGISGDNKTEKGASHGVTSTAIVSSKICEDDVATPAELAKTYMGSRQSKVSPSVQSFRNQTVREVVPFVSQSPIVSLARRPGIFGVTENGFTTPKSRGRSAVYNMARTPYSRVRPTDLHKGGSSTSYLYAGASSSHSKLEPDDLFGSKQVSLKRTSSVLDDDFGSIGPIRRIRQKSNLLYNNGANLPTRRVGVVSAASKHQLFQTQEISKTLEKNHDGATPSTSRFLVPTKSSETAAKILEHIDKLSPKEKPSASKRVAIKEKSSTKLTTNMLHGQALRSLEHLDSSRLLQSASNTYEPDNHANATLPDASDSKLPKHGSVLEDRPTNFVDTVNHVANREVTFSGRDAPASADSIHPKFAALPPEKKCAFKMSAPEDSLELDEDIGSNVPASKPLSEGNGKQKMPLVSSKFVSSEELSKNKGLVFPEINTPPGFLSKRTDEQTPNGVNTSVKYSGLSTNEDLQAGKLNNTYGTEIKGSSLALTGSKLDSLSSPTNLASGPTDAWPRLPMDDNSLKAGINGTLEAPSVASTSTTTTTTTSLFAVPYSNLSNGNFSPNPVLSSSSVLAASNSESHTGASSVAAPSISAATTNVTVTSSVIKPGTSIFSSTTNSTPATFSNSETSDLNVKSEKLENGTSLGNQKSLSFAGTNTIFGLNSSVMATSTATQPQGSLFSTGGGSTVSANPLLPQCSNTTSPQTISSLFGSSTSSPVLGTSGVTSFSSLSATAPASKPFCPDTSRPTSAAPTESNQVGSTSSGIFSFGATSALPSNGVTTVTPSFGVSPVAPAPETKVLSPSTGSTPALFSFSNSSTSASTNAGPAIASFGSSSAASTSTSSTPVFGFSGNSSGSSSSSTTPGVLSLGGSSAASSSSSITPGVFSFGGSSVASSSGSTTPAVFSFGGSSAASSSSSTTPAVFGFSGSSASSSSSSSTPAVFGFGGNSASSTSGSTTPSVFSFGGSSAPSSSGSTTPAVFGFGGNSAASSATGVSNTAPGTFNFGASSLASSQASQGGAVAGIFGSSQQPSSGAFGSSPSSIGFTFGASSSSFSTSNTAPMPFGSSPGASSSPLFGFGNATPSFTTSPGNNEQMTMEDSMAEDPVQQSSSPAISLFGQPSNSPAPAPAPSSFVFGSPNPFQFGGQQNQAAPQNPSPFQASGSLELNGGGGSFSLGSNGPDKSGRKIVKVNRNKNRRK
ncbi:PREDICTED: nuclear pore complex protein NUP1-like isoform X2 [Ipomoea nil]|uniref:nuclear pore complex protein NUP1-like isoform X2 n=1 Tax=Ipomoea nil TaxID=35883 RepID=UPI000901034C|nr:PREDICTED: nuclear pore complex protein NUP1-like isoform X2 [Ipomoea nil]